MVGSDKKIEELYKICYSYILKLSANIDLAEEIAADTIYNFACSKHKDENKIDNETAWVVKVSYNLLQKHYKNEIKTRDFKQSYRNEINTKKVKNRFKDSYSELEKYLEKDEFDLLKSYFNGDKEELLKKLEIKESTLRKKISLLKQKVIALANIEKGYSVGNDLITPKLNYKILDFIRYLKKYINDKNSNTLSKYLRNISNDKTKLLESIKDVKKYDFIRRGDNTFDLFLYFFSIDTNLEALTITFKTNDRILEIVNIASNYSTGILVTDKKEEKMIRKILKDKIRNEKGELILDEYEKKIIDNGFE